MGRNIKRDSIILPHGRQPFLSSFDQERKRMVAHKNGDFLIGGVNLQPVLDDIQLIRQYISIDSGVGRQRSRHQGGHGAILAGVRQDGGNRGRRVRNSQIDFLNHKRTPGFISVNLPGRWPSTLFEDDGYCRTDRHHDCRGPSPRLWYQPT